MLVYCLILRSLESWRVAKAHSWSIDEGQAFLQTAILEAFYDLLQDLFPPFTWPPCGVDLIIRMARHHVVLHIFLYVPGGCIIRI